ncbi:ImmA/IrrE family metallo-endopeptidase [Anoxybacillus sp. ST4]|nr:ImmA/IrrE family metallo-endopeptidase [Anoxybacillus sp. ST4]
MYLPSQLEKYVSELYKSIGIIQPYDLDEKTIAEKLDIYVVYTKFRSFCELSDDCKLIFLNDSLKFDDLKRREVFFHELGHLLRHCGDQTKLPASFRYLQESQAKRFTAFAAIPHHMLTYIDFTQKRDFIIYEMQETFRITTQVCMERLDYIQNKILNKNTPKIYA